ncbi:hypothetical protein BV924_07970 [Pectobacterium odoriferum]|uniref:HEAT repeat domain-containing protein n=1 Tax=Pectobacterium odoriferum TaxID=78398 RepID=A0ABD6VRF7_9GAMM|nr:MULTISPECIES: hypothetical protein [Pectobacterium]MBB1527390.1 hypothetical protein [Pectobacterium carotovorum subsp. carotovorum]POD97440.1 hypothetical protein BVY06_03000 [Pectobacterium odoriferum]POE14386.1 hypothetical protein BV924_07970 [Pectobacterium odoriferum]POE27409.1 hypothetical protein BV926_05645 [Pectobacterium odoriferum]POE32837.1 hypothetical protein BV919_07965 [Pectobacterium odoriferum]
MVITINIQIHGYRKGHQLLASSILLSKEDQTTVDRLSDVAGPLRPKEQFEPYLTAYPLPSGTYYVIARTWQDHSVPRAGCVRTKSLLVNANVWANTPPLSAILELLDSSELPSEIEAAVVQHKALVTEKLPPISGFNAPELLESLFLEEPKPVVMFDAPNPELIALHLIVALWPNIRQKFTFSTFALSPRKIMGRDLDLVFSPSNAKARFSDWPGRRVDGRLLPAARHRWTKVIVRRVFEESIPRLLSKNTFKLINNNEAENVSVLRIALLWDELFDKLEQTPTAVLGLLDIANSGMVNSENAMALLKPRLLDIINTVENNLSEKDAWEFAGALARKTIGRDMADCIIAINNLAMYLTEKDPEGVINLIKQTNSDDVINNLVPGIALGLGKNPSSMVKKVLLSVPINIFANLVLLGNGLAEKITSDDELIHFTGLILSELDKSLSFKVGMNLLPLLIEDRHLPVALPIISSLDVSEISDELVWLKNTNDFRSKKISMALINRARDIGGIPEVRKVLISKNSSTRAQALLAQTINPTVDDVLWLLGETSLSEKSLSILLANVIRRADEQQFVKLLSNIKISESVAEHLTKNDLDILERAVLQDVVPINIYVRIVQVVISEVNNDQKVLIAKYALGRCLRNRFENDVVILSMLLNIIGHNLDSKWVIYNSLEREINSELASRNLIVLEKSQTFIRHKILYVVNEIANMLRMRQVSYLNEDANNACARLMFDAQEVSYSALIDAATTLIPSLLNARHKPVSLMIAVLFPIVYKELAKSNALPERLNIFFFFDWDRCKIARNELVEIFMSSSWNAGDLALTACRCDEVSKILKRVAQSYEGKKYLSKIENDLDRLDDGSKVHVKRVIAQLLHE